MFKKIVFQKFEKKETPSGMWDNALYVRSGYVSFPVDFQARAIVESFKFKTENPKAGGPLYVLASALGITVDGQTWLVVPGGKIENEEAL